MRRAELTAERLRSLLDYDPASGLFTNRVSRGAAKAGKCSGGAAFNGYRLIAIDGVRLYAHRLAWLHTHGEWPKWGIDHINGVRDDNRLANLRDVPPNVNSQNLGRAKSHNALGVLGVRRMRDKFQARIVVDGKVAYLGTYAELAQARDAYLAAKRQHHAGFVEERS
jgi:hypothetical protein